MALCSPSIPQAYKGISPNATRGFEVTPTNPSVRLNRMNRETLGDRLSQVLKEQGISQSELARRVGVKQQAIQYLCKNRAKRSAYVAEIAWALDVSVMWLAIGKGLQRPWGALGRDAQMVAKEYEELPVHGQKQLQDYLSYLRKRFPSEEEPSYHRLKDC